MNQDERIDAATRKQMEADLKLANNIIANFDNPRVGGPIVYILACAANEATDATLALTKVSPTNVQEITRLQAMVTRQKDIVRWLQNALIVGKEAFDLLDLRERGLLFEEVTDSLSDNGE